EVWITGCRAHGVPHSSDHLVRSAIGVFIPVQPNRPATLSCVRRKPARLTSNQSLSQPGRSDGRCGAGTHASKQRSTADWHVATQRQRDTCTKVATDGTPAVFKMNSM